ncbi:MAG TPA: GntR family transcriptional regulator [Usitatibacter sp.]|jgi:DNA-binding GntR family transcriptional regulator|nr:GntR family transcriptional regulator [Usitatibacter sp.]
MIRMPLALPPEDFRRLDRFLPRGLAGAPEAGTLERAAGYLARLVLGHRVMPGQKIPMDDIAAHIGASRTPVREALRLLETEGLVAALPNRGFIVRRMEAAEIAHLYEARRCIESFVAREAFLKRSRPFLQELRALHRIYANLLGGGGDRRRLGMLVDKAFHVRIAEQAGNPHLAALLANMFDRLILTRPLEDFPLGRMGEAVAEHAHLLAQLESGTARSVEAAVTRNISNGGAAIVAHMQSTPHFSLST